MNMTGETPLRTTIAIALSAIGAAATVGWIAANGVRDIKSDIAELRSEVLAQREEAWTYQDQVRWVSVLAKENKFNSLDVPLVPEKNKKRPN